jgi:hypothetical protein
MPDRLELELRALGRELAFPPAPDFSSRVGERLRAGDSVGRGFGRHLARSRLALALAVLAAALAAALAVPPVRAALLDLVGLGGVTIERVDELPPVTPARGLGLGAPVSLAEARRRVDFPVRLPDEDTWGEPDAAYVSSSFPGGAVSLLYGDERRVRLLVTQFRGSTEPALVKKMVAPRTRLEIVTVRGEPGYWIAGAPHGVVFRDASGEIRDDVFRLATNVLLWVEDGVTYRVEADVDRDTALAIAESLR